MSDHKNCVRCNAGMPPFRVNPLCEECFAEESDDYDRETDDEDDDCPWCGSSVCGHLNADGQLECCVTRKIIP